MNVSNLVITGETMEKANKPLSNRKKGELRTQKLKELAESGKLSMIKTRGDLAEAVGYTYAQRGNAGYQWVHYKIERGELKETLVGYTDNGAAEYEYQYVGKPKKGTPLVGNFRVVEPKVVIEEKAEEPTVLATNTVVTIYRGDTTIAIENISDTALVNIIKEFVK